MNKLSGKKFTVIGANSYIARHIVHSLQNKGCEFFLYGKDNVSTDGFQPYSSINISESNEVEKINFDVDFVMVFSGLTGTTVGFEQYDSFIRVNEIGLLNILSAIKKRKKKPRIIFPSSRLIYRGGKRILKEFDEKELKTIYALNKFNGENYLKIYNECFQIPYTIFRICVPYGNLLDNTFSYGTLGHFISSGLKGEDIAVFGHGVQKRSFIHIYDLTEILLSTLSFSKSENKIFNIGGPEALSIKSVAKSIAALYGVKVIFKKWPLLLKKIESGDTVFDSTAIEQLTGYKYQYSFKKWLKEKK